MSLTPELNQLVYSVIAFIILWILLAKVALPPLIKAIDDRQNKIKLSLDEAENARKEGERLLDEYKAQLQGARSEAQSIIDQRKKQAEVMHEEIVEKSKQQAGKIIEQSKQELESEKKRILSDIQKNIATWSVDIAEKIIKKELSESQQKEIIKQSLLEIEKTD